MLLFLQVLLLASSVNGDENDVKEGGAQCYYLGLYKNTGETLRGQYDTCECNNGKWMNCIANVELYDDDFYTDSEESFQETSSEPTDQPIGFSLTANPRPTTDVEYNDGGGGIGDAITDSPTPSVQSSPTIFTSVPTFYPTPMGGYDDDDELRRTDRPTLNRTEELGTKKPVESPTEPPIEETPSPTFSTPAPTNEPTPQPTLEPTPDPTLPPNPDPTFPPPTKQPTTPEPTPDPTPQPTPDPTPQPTQQEQPQEEYPVLVPLPQYPVETDNASPTIPIMTVSPRPAATNHPTSSSTYPLQTNYVKEVKMRLYPFPPYDILDEDDQNVWISVTEKHIVDHLTSDKIIPPIDDVVDVTINILNQMNEKNDRMSFQESVDNLVSLYITFNVSMAYRSERDTYDADILLFGAFDSLSDRVNYIETLHVESSTFEMVELIQVDLNGYAQTPTEAPDTEIDSNENKMDDTVDTAVIIGATIGGVALIILIGLVLFRQRRSTSKDNTTSKAAAGCGNDSEDAKSPTNTTTINTPTSVSPSAAEQQLNAAFALAATPSIGEKNQVHTEIVLEPQEDISTIGEPYELKGMYIPGILGGAGGVNVCGSGTKDERTASVDHDYDYMKEYRNYTGHGGDQQQDPLSLGKSGGSTLERDRTMSAGDGGSTRVSSMRSSLNESFTKLGKLGENIFADDDNTFEQQFSDPEHHQPTVQQAMEFSVVAPPGKLGMVIDTPPSSNMVIGGAITMIPIVHAIKETSVLAGRVHVGDRLISVDGEDCTGMNAVEVSKLISLKSEKPARILTFSRSSALGAQSVSGSTGGPVNRSTSYPQ